ncbi:MAG: helix-turn-helix domain-containing protein, partial [Bacilli bacterium]|nr:helix-turn-helix domain-containing protein [Bacilli bacterium]
MLKALKFRMYPTPEQKHTLNQFIGTSRFIYNTYL